MRDEAPHTDDHGVDKDDCRSGTRNRYFRGKTLKADDFETEQRYQIGRRRLITRSALGWGVVHGLAVEGSRTGLYDKDKPDDRYSDDPPRDQKEQSDEDPKDDAAPTCAEP